MPLQKSDDYKISGVDASVSAKVGKYVNRYYQGLF